jgi:NAD(P)-dependent dehydrogenase (short-subunit alcohol dehydrogenase family)
VYACAPDLSREHEGADEARKKVQEYHSKFKGDVVPGEIKFHALDLSSVHDNIVSTEKLKSKITDCHKGRLDILVCNAGVASTSTHPSVDGNDETFAINCLGHFVFLDTILGKNHIPTNFLSLLN